MINLVHITVENQGENVRIEHLDQQSYLRAINSNTSRFMESLGGQEIPTTYGIKSISPNGKTVAYIGNLNQMPKNVQSYLKEENNEERD